MLGAFYAVEMKDVRDEGRIDASIEPPPGTRVHYAWDLGVGDDTAIWAFSHVAGQLWVYWFYASSGVGLEHYRDVIEANEQQMGWLHGTDYVPHDAKVKELGTGRTRVETMHSMGLAPHACATGIARRRDQRRASDAAALRVSSATGSGRNLGA